MAKQNQQQPQTQPPAQEGDKVSTPWAPAAEHATKRVGRIVESAFAQAKASGKSDEEANAFATAAVDEALDSKPVAAGEKRWFEVRLTHHKPRKFQVSSSAEAVEAYKKFYGIAHTVHTFQCEECEAPVTAEVA